MFIYLFLLSLSISYRAPETCLENELGGCLLSQWMEATPPTHPILTHWRFFWIFSFPFSESQLLIPEYYMVKSCFRLSLFNLEIKIHSTP